MVERSVSLVISAMIAWLSGAHHEMVAPVVKSTTM